MPQDVTLHVKLDASMAENLTRLAGQRKMSKGQIVRQALVACYQPGILGLTQKQEQALHAYRGGYISLGKLASVFGMHVLELRTWLCEHGIIQNNLHGSQDTSNA